MSTINYLTLRNANWNVFGVSSIVNSTITTTSLKTSTISIVSSIVSLGQSTNAANFGQSQGSYANTTWYSTLNSTFTPTAVTKVSMVANAQYQLAVNGQSTISSIMLTQNTGQLWTSLSQATGLPSATTTNYSSGAICSLGIYSLLAANGGYLYLSNNLAASYANVNPNTPYAHYKFDGNLTDSQGNLTLTATGSPTYVPGIVGTNAINFINSAGNAPTQYTQATIPTLTTTPVFSVSGWFNIQSFPTSGNVATIVSLGTNAQTFVTIQYLNTVTYGSVYTGIVVSFINSSNTVVVVASQSSISLNTWYNFTLIFQASGTCFFYLNNILIGSAAGAALLNSATTLALASLTHAAVQGFNGYVDDLKYYTSAIAFSPMVPANWSNVAISGNAQYMLATAANNGLFMSSNFGSTWSQISSVALQAYWTGLSLSHSGQYMLASGTITPQLTGLVIAATTTWTVNNVAWTATASDVFNTNYYAGCAFNNVLASGGNGSWASGPNYTIGTGTYIGTTYSTVILGGVGTKYGSWLQIQSSVPLVMYSYSFAIANFQTVPYSYYIVGSTDGTNWYPVQQSVFSINPFVSANSNAGWANPCIVNYTGTQTIVGTQSGSCTTTSYSTSTTPYTYFRLVVIATWPSVTGQAAELEEWYINFLGGQSYSTNYGASWTNNFAIPASTALAVSASGQYSLYSAGQTAYISSNYLVGPSYTTPTLTSINAAIIAGALSQTGQYQVVVTAGTTNNLYYSTNYGATFLSISLGAAALTTVTMSYDGSYITAASATTVYTLNSNGTAYTVAVGGNAGQQNQAQNAIAIGSNAGQTNQTANSIILNASDKALNAYDPGLYIAPIATAQQSTSVSYSLLGYGISDNQVVQSGITFANQTQVIYGEWIQLQLTTATSVTSYMMVTRYIPSIPLVSTRYPVAWTIVGSVDGVNWTILDTQTNNSASSGTYTLKNASPIYSYFRMIITQMNSGSFLNPNYYSDIGGFILYNNGAPLFSAQTTNTSPLPYTVSGTTYNILSLNSVLCILTWSFSPTVNSYGVQQDSTAYSTYYPAMIAVANGYNMSFGGAGNNANSFIGFQFTPGSSQPEYNSSLVAFQGTSTTVISPLVQIADLYNNIKYASTSQFALDVNGSMRAQNITFQDGTVQQSASQMQPAWSQFGQGWKKTSLPTGSWYQCALSYSGQYQLVVSNNGPSAIYMSSNYGETWTSLASQTSSSVNWSYCNISYSGQYMSAVYQLGGTAGGFYLSSNYGQTWNYITVSTVQLNAFAMSSSGQYMTCTPAYSTAGYVYISSNYGQTWTPSTLYLTTADLAFSSSMSGSGQYQIVSSTTKIYLSTNYGQIWSIIATVSGTITGSAVSGNGQYMTVSGSGYINVSSNYGQSWIQTSYTGAYGIGFMSQSGQYQIVGNNSAASIYVSTNYGQSFTTVGTPSSTSMFGSTSGSGIYSLYGVNSGGSVYQSIVPSYQLGNVGIGTMSPGASLSVYNNTSSGTSFLLQLYSPSMPLNNFTFIQFGQSATSYNECQMGFFYAGNNSLTNYGFVQMNNVGNILCWTAKGNVGIGITNPDYKLDVIGTIRVTGSYISGTYTTPSVVNGGTTTVSTANLGITSPVILVHVGPFTTGQFYGVAIVYNWNPAIQVVNQLLNGGIGLTLSGSNLLITNNIGFESVFIVYASCFA